MTICNVATVDNSVGTHAIYVAPDNCGEITRFDNWQHTQSRIDPNAKYPRAIKASLLFLFPYMVVANHLSQIMEQMRRGDVNDILPECHYDDWLWGYAIRTIETWWNSDRDEWRDLVLALLFRMGLLN